MARTAKFVGFAKIRGKDVIVFEQHGSMKYTDGFHDKKLKAEDKKHMKMNDLEIRPDKLIKRLRGTRPWHPVLEAIERASTSSSLLLDHQITSR